MTKSEDTKRGMLAQFDGDAAALSAEMSRRAKMRKRVGGGFRNNPDLAKRAVKSRWNKEKETNEENHQPGGGPELPEAE